MTYPTMLLGSNKDNYTTNLLNKLSGFRQKIKKIVISGMKI